jgi:chaperonin GroES
LSYGGEVLCLSEWAERFGVKMTTFYRRYRKFGFEATVCYYINLEKEQSMREYIKILGDRVLVRPEQPKESTPGGIILPDQAREKPARGTVLCVGGGSPSKFLMFNYCAGDINAKKVAEENASKIMGCLALTNPRSASQIWDAVEQVEVNTPIVKEGDTVLYGKYVGTEVSIGEENLIILRESDIIGVVTKEKK